MLDIRVGTITEAVQTAWTGPGEERLRELLVKLAPYLHDYIRDVKLSHAEWLSAIQFLFQAGQISDEKRNEFALLSDILGVTSLVDLLHATPGATIGSVLGPFYMENSPLIALGDDLVKDNDGDVILVSGTIRDQDGHPLQDASIDLWQTDNGGLYAAQDPNQPDDNFRARQNCDAAGRYWFTTVLPAPYTIPMDGPVGALFKRMGRSEWRPSHFHFIVRAAGCEPLVTELFFKDGAYVENDAVFGVREPLILDVHDVTPLDTLPSPLVRRPVKQVRFDFTLMPAAVPHPKAM